MGQCVAVPYATAGLAVEGYRYTHKKTTGAEVRSAEVELDVRPLQRGSGVVLRVQVDHGFPEDLRRSIAAGLVDGLGPTPDEAEVIYPALTDVELVARVGSWHPTDSTPEVFRMITALCVGLALRKGGGPVLLDL